MLKPEEKAYCNALAALRLKQYEKAAKLFNEAADFFKTNKEFCILRETTLLLLQVKGELSKLPKKMLEEVEPA